MITERPLNRRDFLKFTGATAAGLAFASFASSSAFAAAAGRRDAEMNILCWEGYNTENVLGPFRKLHPGIKLRAESAVSDPDMINKLRAGETKVWDLINLNQCWARGQLWPDKLIKPLDRDRFDKYFERMLPWFKGPNKYALSPDGSELLGMVQRFGPFNFVVNTDKISKEFAEDQSFKLFLDPKMKGKYGLLAYDNWNILHLCVAADLNPFVKHSEADIAAFTKVCKQIFSGAKLISGDLVQMNQALVNGEIDAYFTGGTYTSSPARLDGQKNVLAITPKKGPIDGKGGIQWFEVTSLVNNPEPTPRASDFLEFVQKPEICHAVAFAEGTYNPVSQMSDPKVFPLFSKEELDALQWDTIDRDMNLCADFEINPDNDRMMEIYNEVKRSRG